MAATTMSTLSLASSKASLSGSSLKQQKQARKAAAPAGVVCSAQKEQVDLTVRAKQVAVALTCAAIASGSALANPAEVYADVAGLTKCSDSAAFAKRKRNEIRGLEKRLKGYEAGSAPALALQATIDRTEKRFNFYSNSSLLCGADGLPHLIVDGRWSHAGEFLVPGLGFLYIAGWIGWVGRAYIRAIKDDKPTEKEIILDVPKALGIMSTGLIWPVAAVSEFRNGDLIENDANITVSPR
eukprot:jgi/Chlat1/6552/Chrsp45S05931